MAPQTLPQQGTDGWTGAGALGEGAHSPLKPPASHPMQLESSGRCAGRSGRQHVLPHAPRPHATGAGMGSCGRGWPPRQAAQPTAGGAPPSNGGCAALPAQGYKDATGRIRDVNEGKDYAFYKYDKKVTSSVTHSTRRCSLGLPGRAARGGGGQPWLAGWAMRAAPRPPAPRRTTCTDTTTRSGRTWCATVTAAGAGRRRTT